MATALKYALPPLPGCKLPETEAWFDCVTVYIIHHTSCIFMHMQQFIFQSARFLLLTRRSKKKLHPWTNQFKGVIHMCFQSEGQVPSICSFLICDIDPAILGCLRLFPFMRSKQLFKSLLRTGHWHGIDGKNFQWSNFFLILSHLRPFLGHLGHLGTPHL